MELGKYSFGIGDRFARQGRALLAAILKARDDGIDVTPVWNKSQREHSIIGTAPADVRAEADEAVAACGWEGQYFVDADHIGLGNVEHFIEPSDFFTLDVAEFIGRPADASEVEAFVARHRELVGSVQIDGLDEPLRLSREQLKQIAGKYLAAIGQAGRSYRHIKAAKRREEFLVEVSMDETDQPQTPAELLVILAAIADEGIPVATIAPRFSGRFNKGVDYVGDVSRFAREFESDLAVVAFAVKEYGLAGGLKLSVHSGSDKFSIYEPINRALRKFGAGVHIKTAGTTWLEELAGLAVAGADGLQIAKEIYAGACTRMDELCGPYASVIDIDRSQLPGPDEVQGWTGEQFATALRHDQSCGLYNPHFRQLCHVAYKIAAQMAERFTTALERHAETIAPGVTANIYERHIKLVFARLSG